MKYLKISLTILMLSIFSLGYSQSYSEAHFGIKAGVNFSNLYAKDVNDENILAGYQLGVFGKFPMNDMFALQLEALYTTKGAKLTYNSALLNGEAKFNLNYIEVPILLVVNITPNLNIHAGPYVAYLVGGKVTNESDASLFDFENNINKDNFNKIDAGLCAGLGLDLKPFGLGIRYSYGMTTVGKEATFNELTYTFPNAKNSLLSMYLTFALN